MKNIASLFKNILNFFTYFFTNYDFETIKTIFYLQKQ